MNRIISVLIGLSFTALSPTWAAEDISKALAESNCMPIHNNGAAPQKYVCSSELETSSAEITNKELSLESVVESLNEEFFEPVDPAMEFYSELPEVQEEETQKR